MNPVNAAGVMGAGLALAFKERFPNNFFAYRTACELGRVRVGTVHIADLGDALPVIINFPTKHHWRDEGSDLSSIRTGLDSLVAEVKKRNLRSVAIPALGCGLGGLEWGNVLPLIERAAGDLPDVRVIVFPPANT